MTDTELTVGGSQSFENKEAETGDIYTTEKSAYIQTRGGYCYKLVNLRDGSRLSLQTPEDADTLKRKHVLEYLAEYDESTATYADEAEITVDIL